MRGSMTNFLEDELVDHILRNAAWSSPTTVYLALFTVAPGEAGGGTEVSGGAYARQSITFSAPSGGATSNSAKISFPQATADWGLVIHWAIFDAVTSGNMLFHGPLAEASLAFVGEDTGDVLTVPGHTFSNDDKVRLKGASLPTGLSEDTLYYVISVSGNTLQLSLSQGGGAVAITADGSGDIALVREKQVDNGDTFEVAIGDLDVALE